jgi:hypothetical protein
MTFGLCFPSATRWLSFMLHGAGKKAWRRIVEKTCCSASYEHMALLREWRFSGGPCASPCRLLCAGRRALRVYLVWKLVRRLRRRRLEACRRLAAYEQTIKSPAGRDNGKEHTSGGRRRNAVAGVAGSAVFRCAASDGISKAASRGNSRSPLRFPGCLLRLPLVYTWRMTVTTMHC